MQPEPTHACPSEEDPCSPGPEDFRGFFALYYPRVLGFVQYRLRDFACAEEVASDALFEFWRRAPSFRGDCRPSTWLFGIASFKCREAHRNRRRLKRAALTPTEPAVLLRILDPVPLERRLEARSEMLWIAQKVRELPAHQRELVEQACEERSTEEIAARLGISMGATKSRLHHVRRVLRASSSYGELRSAADQIGAAVAAPRPRFCAVPAPARSRGR